jgi:hypothetical protein
MTPETKAEAIALVKDMKRIFRELIEAVDRALEDLEKEAGSDARADGTGATAPDE